MAVAESPSPVEAHVTLTVVSLSVVISQVQDNREVEKGQRHTTVVSEEKAVASASPQIPP